MVHPGLRVPADDDASAAGCGTGPDDFACSADREVELATLTGAVTLAGVVVMWSPCRDSSCSIWATCDTDARVCRWLKDNVHLVSFIELSEGSTEHPSTIQLPSPFASVVDA